MTNCDECGHPLGIGRFCTNCGQPVAGRPGAHAALRTDTAERPKVAATGVTAPATPRAPAGRVLPPPPVAQPTPEPTGTWQRGLHPGRWLPWAAGLVALALVAGVGAWLLVGQGDDEPATTAFDPSPGEVAARPGRPTDLARSAEITAPAPAPASRDTSGAVVRYVAANLVDGSPETCWRMPGDGTGVSIRFRFERPVRLREVGLINGYAKRTSDSQGVLDWYAGNRRVLAVEWTFDDGTVVTQELGETTEVQTLSVDDVETETVTLRLLQVTPPGPGRASRDYTAISDVRLLGSALN